MADSDPPTDADQARILDGLASRGRWLIAIDIVPAAKQEGGTRQNAPLGRRSSREAAEPAAKMVVYNFKKIQTVPAASDFIDIVLTRTQRKTPTVIHP
ncbi:hypothetical protein BBJ28_00011315, partial [Nothophytophthora sp. Chile5]